MGKIAVGLAVLLGRMPWRRALFALGAGLLLAGCAGSDGPLVFRRGEMEPGHYLTTVVVKEGGCWPYGHACTIQTTESATMVLPLSPDTPASVYEIFAHELCHAMAGLRHLAGPAGPCHREDGGRLGAGPALPKAERERLAISTLQAVERSTRDILQRQTPTGSRAAQVRFEGETGSSSGTAATGSVAR